jgi:hypothetical protein
MKKKLTILAIVLTFLGTGCTSYINSSKQPVPPSFTATMTIWIESPSEFVVFDV